MSSDSSDPSRMSMSKSMSYVCGKSCKIQQSARFGMEDIGVNSETSSPNWGNSGNDPLAKIALPYLSINGCVTMCSYHCKSYRYLDKMKKETILVG